MDRVCARVLMASTWPRRREDALAARLQLLDASMHMRINLFRSVVTTASIHLSGQVGHFACRISGACNYVPKDEGFLTVCCGTWLLRIETATLLQVLAEDVWPPL